MQRKTLEHTTLNGMSPANPSLEEEEAERVEEPAEGMEDTRRTWSSKSSKQSSYDLTETEAAYKGLHGSYIRYPAY